MILGLTACETVEQVPIEGKWQAYEVLEEGDSMKLNPNAIRFEFFPLGTYLFEGTVGHREAGTYRVSGNLLYTKDTLANSPEKAVEISHHTLDSLSFKMQSDDNKAQLIKLLKVK